MPTKTLTEPATAPGTVPTLPEAASLRLAGSSEAIASQVARRIATEITLPGHASLHTLKTVVMACRDGTRVLIQRLESGRGPRPGDLDHLAQLGALQAEEGVPLEILLASYRIAARVVWEQVVRVLAQEVVMPPETLASMATQLFAYLDEISGTVGNAYLARHERLVRQRDRDRDQTLQRLIAGDVTPQMLRTAASVGLNLEPPYQILACSAEEIDSVMDQLWRPAKALVAGTKPGNWILLLPEKSDAEQLAKKSVAKFGHLRICVGPHTTKLEDIADAARRTERALEVGSKLDPSNRLMHESETGLFASLAADEPSLRSFVGTVLGPLAEPGFGRREEWLATLQALVENDGLGEAAERLGVHRHTVVYRLQRLEQMGISVSEPEQRHRIWLALKGLQILR